MMNSRKGERNFPFSSYWFVTITLTVIAWYCAAFPVGILERFHSECMPSEQLPKWSLLLSFGLSVSSLKFSTLESDIKLSKAFILLCTAIYFGQSNFINTSLQGIIGFALSVFILKLLWERNPAALISFVAFGLLILFKLVADILDDLSQLEVWRSDPEGLFRTLLLRFMDLEALYGLLGGAVLLQTVCLTIFEQVQKLLKTYSMGIVVLALGFPIVSIGNSILHFQDTPTVAMKVAGCLISSFGLLIVVISNKRLFGTGDYRSPLGRAQFQLIPESTADSDVSFDHVPGEFRS